MIKRPAKLPTSTRHNWQDSITLFIKWLPLERQQQNPGYKSVTLLTPDKFHLREMVQYIFIYLLSAYTFPDFKINSSLFPCLGHTNEEMCGWWIVPKIKEIEWGRGLAALMKFWALEINQSSFLKYLLCATTSRFDVKPTQGNSSQLRVTNRAEVSPKSTKSSQAFWKELRAPPETVPASHIPSLAIIYCSRQVTKPG